MQAKYPKELRFQWYNFVEVQKYTVKETCQLFGIQRKIYYYWYPQDHGLKPGEYRPKSIHPNTKLTRDLKIFIEKEKLKTNYGPAKMSAHVYREKRVKISSTIIYRFYLKKKLIRKPQKRMPWYTPMKKALTIRKPGEGVQLDIKYVYESGVRKYQFSVFDPFTCKYSFKIFATKHSQNARLTFRSAEKYFGFKIISVQTDNGSEFRGDFHDWLTLVNIPHYFIPRKSPWWNSQVERIHRTVDEEYYHNPYRVWKTVYEWLNYYNFERIHLTAGNITPQEKLEQYQFQQIFTPQYILLPAKCVTMGC